MSEIPENNQRAGGDKVDVDNAPSRRFKGRWYAASFLFLLMPIGDLLFLVMHSGALSLRVIWWTWGGSAATGIICAFVGSGGLTRRATDKLGGLAVALHTSSVALLLAFMACAASGGAP